MQSRLEKAGYVEEFAIGTKVCADRTAEFVAPHGGHESQSEACLSNLGQCFSRPLTSLCSSVLGRHHEFGNCGLTNCGQVGCSLLANVEFVIVKLLDQAVDPGLKFCSRGCLS